MNITLKAARVNKGYTQKRAAHKIGVTQYTVCSWERGKTYPTVLQVKDIEQVYDVPFEQLIFLPKKDA